LASELVLANVSLAKRPDPKIAIVPCPRDGRDSAASSATDGQRAPSVIPPMCLWVAVTVAEPPDARLSFFKALDTQQPFSLAHAAAREFAPRYTTSMRPVPERRERRAGTMQSDGAEHGVWASGRSGFDVTRSGLSLKNAAYEVIVASDGATFTVTPMSPGQDGQPRTFQSTFAVIMSVHDPELSDVVDAAQGPTTGSSLCVIDNPSLTCACRSLSIASACSRCL
jgi:hypothetical protein